MAKPHLLFVCSRNQWRSPTAEAVFKNDSRMEVRSAGTSAASPHQLSNNDLAWADLVLVMERSHKTRIKQTFQEEVTLPPIVSLDIPDDYQKMDPELIELIKEGTSFHLAEQFGIKPELD